MGVASFFIALALLLLHRYLLSTIITVFDPFALFPIGFELSTFDIALQGYLLFIALFLVKSTVIKPTRNFAWAVS